MLTKTDAYVVPFAELKRVAGSRDRDLLEAIRTECAWMLEEADINRQEGCDLTCAEALARIIEGDDLRDVPHRLGYLYGNALESLFFDQAPGDCSSSGVKFVSAMRSFAEEYEFRVAGELN